MQQLKIKEQIIFYLITIKLIPNPINKSLYIFATW